MATELVLGLQSWCLVSWFRYCNSFMEQVLHRVQYSNELQCLKNGLEGSLITVRQAMATRTCSIDLLQIYAGALSSYFIQSFCGNSSVNLVVNSSYIIMEFYSDFSNTFSGFEIRFEGRTSADNIARKRSLFVLGNLLVTVASSRTKA